MTVTIESIRAVVAEFYRRVFDDVMIGFMFAGKDRARLIQFETELAANILGLPGIPYTGRPMRAAHAQHTIFGGQFERRMKLLTDVLEEQRFEPEAKRTWLEHTASLRSQITRDRGAECGDDPNPGPRIARDEPPADRPIKLGRK